MKNSLFANPQIHLLIIVVLGFCIYSNTFDAPFVFDDNRYITYNPAIKDLQYFEDPSKVKSLDIAPELQHAFRTRYLGHLSFALNYRLNGLDVTGYHAVNFIIHIANALLVYCLVLLTFRTPFFVSQNRRKSDLDILKYRKSIALVSALLFVSHPIQTQAVTYITQRFASLATLFYLLSAVAYVKSRMSQATALRHIGYVISLSAAILAMLTKEISFTLPVVIALYEFMFFDGDIKKRALRLVPLGLTMFIIPHSLVAANSSGGEGAGLGESMRSLAISHDVSRWEYLITEFRVIVTYFRLLIYPVDQNLYYDHPVYRSIFIPEVLASLFLLLVIASLAVYFLCRSLNDQSKNRHGLRLLAFGIIWFFTTLSIESSIVPIRDVIFEHRVYLPSVGIFLAFSVAVLLLASHLNTSSVSAGGAAMAILLPIVLVLSAVSYARNGVWQTEISLWEDVVKKSPAVGHNHTQLAIAYDEDGRAEDAMRAYKNAIDLDPLQAVARNNLGLHYVRLGRIEEGIREYHETIRISPKDHHMAYINLGVAYYTLRRDEDAIREYRKALQLEPADPITHYNLGLAYERAGRAEEAIREYRGAIEHNRDFLQAYFRLGEISYALERFEDAQRAFQSALERDPNHVGARKGLDRSIQMKR